MDARFRGAAAALSAAAGHAGARVDGCAAGCRQGNRSQLPHAPLQVVHPQHLFRYPDHADAVSRRRGHLDQRRGCPKNRCQRQRLAGVLQRQRGRDGKGRGQPEDTTGKGLHVPCPGTSDQHPGVASCPASGAGPTTASPGSWSNPPT